MSKPQRRRFPVITTSTFAYIVEDSRQNQQLFLLNSWIDFTTDRVLIVVFDLTKSVDVLEQANTVFINGVNME